MIRTKFSLLTASALLVATACGQGASTGEAPAVSATPAAAPTPAAPAAPAEPSLVAPAPALPEGITLDVQNVGGVSIKLPVGWPREPMGLGAEVRDEASGMRIMIQTQRGVPAEARAMYVESFIGVNTRDAPQYRVAGRALGTVAGKPAARVDGTFDNGTAHATRDYVVFVNGNATAVMVRGPASALANVQALADAVVSSLGG